MSQQDSIISSERSETIAVSHFANDLHQEIKTIKRRMRTERKLH